MSFLSVSSKKGKAVVIMKHQNHEGKINQFVKDMSFQQLDTDPTSKYYLTWNVVRKDQTNPKYPKLRGKIKIHK